MERLLPGAADAGSYGAGPTRALVEAGFGVLGVDRPAAERIGTGPGLPLRTRAADQIVVGGITECLLRARGQLIQVCRSRREGEASEG